MNNYKNLKVNVRECLESTVTTHEAKTLISEACVMEQDGKTKVLWITLGTCYCILSNVQSVSDPKLD